MSFIGTKKFAWSYSRWSCYALCPAQYRYRFILKLPEEKSPAMERGGAIHDLTAQIMRREESVDALIGVITAFPELQDELQHLQNTGFVPNGGGVEAQLAVNEQWEKAEWFGTDTWCRGIVDLWVKDYYDPGHALLVDWKTGKFSEWKIKDYEEQLKLFAEILFANEPSVKIITAKLIFLDAGIGHEIGPIERPSRRSKEKIKWGERATHMADDVEFKPTPNRLCSWCSFSKTKGGLCKVG